MNFLYHKFENGQNLSYGAEEMAQQVRVLCRHGGLSANPQHPQNKPGLASCLWPLHCAKGRRITRACSAPPGSVIDLASEHQGNGTGHFMSSIGLCGYTCITHSPVHTYGHKDIH